MANPWLPTDEGLASLPEGARLYIRALEADRDQDGMVRANALLRDQVDQLGERVKRLHAVVLEINRATLAVLV